MNSSIKTILIITQCFPPHGGSGVQRPLFFSKYLSELGWRCIVLTTEEDDFQIKDYSLVNHINSTTKIIRTKDPKTSETLYNWSTRADRKIAKFISQIPIIWKIGNKLSKTTRTLFRPLVRLFSIPDYLVGCLPSFLWHGFRIIKSEKPDIIFSTSPPPTTHLVGFILSKIKRIPWVADLRDEWTLNPNMRYPDEPYKKLDQMLEKLILNSADKVISTTPAIANDTAKNIKRDMSDFITITNGHIIDIPYISNELSEKKLETINFLFSGTLLKERSPETLLQALVDILHDNNDLENSFFLHFIGDIKFHEFLLSHAWIKYHGYLTHPETINKINNSNILVLLVGINEKRSFAGKIFEYLALGKPLLIVCPTDSITYEFFKGIENHIYLSDIRDVESIKQQLLLIFDLWKKNKIPFFINRPEANKYHRRELTKQLDKVLKELLISN